jgi:hypothetical protein
VPFVTVLCQVERNPKKEARARPAQRPVQLELRLSRLSPGGAHFVPVVHSDKDAHEFVTRPNGSQPPASGLLGSLHRDVTAGPSSCVFRLLVCDMGPGSGSSRVHLRLRGLLRLEFLTGRLRSLLRLKVARDMTPEIRVPKHGGRTPPPAV